MSKNSAYGKAHRLTYNESPLVAEEYDGVTTGDLALKLAEDVVEGGKIAVDITDCDRGHVD